MGSWKVRLAGLALALATAWYLPWLLSHLNLDAPWLSIPFALASLLMAAMTLVTVINHWQYVEPPLRPASRGKEERVLVIIPTAGEPAEMVDATARSVLDQDYPTELISLVVSDDAHSPAMKAMTVRLAAQYPRAIIGYHEPPPRGDPLRRGEAKAGNLNSVLDQLAGEAGVSHAQVGYIETRDADDLVGNPSFLRQLMGQMQADPSLGFVQTIKESRVSAGDPFGNQEPLFYRRAMLAKNAANAVFPCGSGLLWRRLALEDIGGFPTWNLVEDLQSGVEALRRGWKGLYLPIIGAIGQTAPEDVPNAVKQRGTWALDTMRLTLWGDKSGLTLRQHLHFAELGVFYMLSMAVLVFLSVPIMTLLFDIYPLIASQSDYALHFWPYALAIELLLISLAKGLPYEDLWRSRQTWLGMAPVYFRALVLALLYGPHRKPAYRVTRKTHSIGFHWRESLPQWVFFLLLIGACIHHGLTRDLLREADLGSIFWAVFFAVGLARFVGNSWHGMRLAPRPLRMLLARLGISFDG